MKNIYLKLLLVFLLATPVFGEGFGTGGGYTYFDGGNIYTNTTVPSSIAKSAGLNDTFISSKEKVNLSDLKVGVSVTTNILGLIQIGDAGIMAAIKNGDITKVHYIETKRTKIYIPLGFIPIYVAGIETRVYGE